MSAVTKYAIFIRQHPITFTITAIQTRYTVQHNTSAPYDNVIHFTKFGVLLTVHLSRTLAINQLNAQIHLL